MSMSMTPIGAFQRASPQRRVQQPVQNRIAGPVATPKFGQTSTFAGRNTNPTFGQRPTFMQQPTPIGMPKQGITPPPALTNPYAELQKLYFGDTGQTLLNTGINGIQQNAIDAQQPIQQQPIQNQTIQNQAPQPIQDITQQVAGPVVPPPPQAPNTMNDYNMFMQQNPNSTMTYDDFMASKQSAPGPVQPTDNFNFKYVPGQGSFFRQLKQQLGDIAGQNQIDPSKLTGVDLTGIAGMLSQQPPLLATGIKTGR